VGATTDIMTVSTDFLHYNPLNAHTRHFGHEDNTHTHTHTHLVIVAVATISGATIFHRHKISQKCE